MIDLHLHLDGSLDIEDYKYLASSQGVDLGEDFPNNIKVESDCKSLNEYLEKFDLPLSLLQTPLSLSYSVTSLVNRLYKLGYIYVEIRFAPSLHTRKGMSQEDAVIAAISGLKFALKDKPDFDANLILCLMRQNSEKDNLETVKLAEKYRKNKVVAIDLAGPEDYLSAKNYTKIFSKAYEKNLNIIIHAGEARGSQEVVDAVNLLHAKRIGHGVHMELNSETIRLMSEKRIGFEFCPTSNLQTTSLPDYNSLPLKQFMSCGLLVNINSDNMTISGTNVIEELKHLNAIHHFQEYDIRQLLNNSIDMAFVDELEKIKLREKLSCRIHDFYKQIIELN